jgi:hypothetical protein
LTAYKNRKIKIENLVDWVNTIWFTDLYSYDDSQADSIASVIDKLEELDEDGREITKCDIDKYICTLSNNQEI